ncbi:MAG: hypothetical protein KY461_13825 [Actinobacteria bacterium]|nr:hypothetical protein [Actinomycetota bacterium]
MSTATILAPPPVAPPRDCRPRQVVVSEELPELLAAYRVRDDLRRSGGPVAELAAAADRLARARGAVRAAC